MSYIIATKREDECDATMLSATRLIETLSIPEGIIGLYAVGGSCVHVARYTYNKTSTVCSFERDSEKYETFNAKTPFDDTTALPKIKRVFKGVTNIIVAGSSTMVVLKNNKNIRDFKKANHFEDASKETEVVTHDELVGIENAAKEHTQMADLDAKGVSGLQRKKKKEGDPDPPNPGYECIQLLRKGTEEECTFYFGSRYFQSAEETVSAKVNGKDYTFKTKKPYYITEKDTLAKIIFSRDFVSLSSGDCKKVHDKGLPNEINPEALTFVTAGHTMAMREVEVAKLKDTLRLKDVGGGAAAAGDGSPLAQRRKFNATAPFTEQTLHHATQTKMYALMGSFADEREISNQHELVTAFHDFVTSGKFETSGWVHTPGEPSVFVDKGYKIGDYVTLKDLKDTEIMPNLSQYNGSICQIVPMQEDAYASKPNGYAYYTVPEGTRINEGEWKIDPKDYKKWYHLLLDGEYTVFNLPDKYFRPYNEGTDGSRHGPAYLWGKTGSQPPAYKTSCKMLGVPSRGGRKVAL